MSVHTDIYFVYSSLNLTILFKTQIVEMSTFSFDANAKCRNFSISC